VSKSTDFISEYKREVVNSTIGTGIFPSVKMAQAGLETGWGASKPGNNLFGIKASGGTSPYWNGEKVMSNTQEYIDGVAGTYNLAFRKYKSITDSIRDHSYFLRVNDRYANAGVFTAETPEDQARALKAAGYATSPTYAEALIGIINQYGLKSLDTSASRIQKTGRLSLYLSLAFLGTAGILGAIYLLVKHRNLKTT